MSDPRAYTPEMAADPALSQADMQQIAASRPDLLPALAANPALYPQLRQWLENHPDPAVKAALAGGISLSTAAPVADTPPSAGLAPVADTPPSARSTPPAVQPTQQIPAVTQAPPVLQVPAVAATTRAKSAVPPWVWALIGALAVVLLAGAVYLGSALAGSDSGQDTASEPAPTASVDGGAVPTAEPAPASVPTPQITRAPTSSSPAPVQDYLLIDSESENLSCELHEDWVGCSVLERDFSTLNQTDCSDRLFSISTARGHADLACGSSFLGEPGDHVTRLDTWDTATFGNVSCTLPGNGAGEVIHCEHLDGSASFWIDEGSYSLG